MYPANLFALFPPFPKENTVFVAMSFAERFENRWKNVIAPAIKSVRVNQVPLNPIRVDAREISDSILTEILTGIGNSRLIFADVTTIGFIDERPIRNGNVMYEIGIAQATRLPEEVILFRSDSDSLPFDTSAIRVNSYSPDENVAESIDKITSSILASYKEIDLKKHLAVSKATESLDGPSWWLLSEICTTLKVTHPETKTMGQILGATSRLNSINRLLEMGSIKTVYPKISKELLSSIGDKNEQQIFMYEATEFGISVFHNGASRLNLFSPEIEKTLEESIKSEGTEV